MTEPTIREKLYKERRGLVLFGLNILCMILMNMCLYALDSPITALVFFKTSSSGCISAIAFISPISFSFSCFSFSRFTFICYGLCTFL